MQEFNLPSPDIGGKGHHLRRVAASAISYIEIGSTIYAEGKHPNADSLSKFFTASMDAALADGLSTPFITFAPIVKTYSIAAGATAGPTISKDGSAGAVTYSSSATGTATVNSATGAVTGVAAGTCWIIASIAATATHRAFTVRYLATVTA